MGPRHNSWTPANEDHSVLPISPALHELWRPSQGMFNEVEDRQHLFDDADMLAMLANKRHPFQRW